MHANCSFALQPWNHVPCRARSPDDARDTFKTLKNQHIGDASAHLYYEWACLEHAAGNVSKALGVLAKGIRAEAQPARCGMAGTASLVVSNVLQTEGNR
jgi:lipopolysaccharide biosynthesis regulator YciM